MLRWRMAFGLRKEKEFEWWLLPHRCRVRMPGYRVQEFLSTRLFFHHYWKLQITGYTEQQIADLALAWRHRLGGTHPEIALVQAVFDLADYQCLEAEKPFLPALSV